jgi:hypothetical protein
MIGMLTILRIGLLATVLVAGIGLASVRPVLAVETTSSPTNASPTSVPTGGPSAAHTSSPTPAPNSAPKASTSEKFVVGDYVFAPNVYNEYSAGNSGRSGSYAIRGAIEFPAVGLPWMLEADARSYTYAHNGAAPVNLIGSYGSTTVPTFTARDTDFDTRWGVKIADPRIYVGVGYLARSENYQYPTQHGVGIGAEKLPDLDHQVSVYGSAWYYPSITGNVTFPSTAPPALAGTTQQVQQSMTKYQLGGTYGVGNTGLFVDAGVLGDAVRNKSNAPADATHNGAYLGLGLKF